MDINQLETAGQAIKRYMRLIESGVKTTKKSAVFETLEAVYRAGGGDWQKGAVEISPKDEMSKEQRAILEYIVLPELEVSATARAAFENLQIKDILALLPKIVEEKGRLAPPALPSFGIPPSSLPENPFEPDKTWLSKLKKDADEMELDRLAADRPKATRTPKGIVAMNRWRARWEKVKPQWRKGNKNYTYLANWLTETIGLKTSPESLADIIAAGEDKKLD